MNTLGVAAGEVVSCQLTAETKFRRGEKSVTAADIKVGERVMVETVEKDGKAIATLVLLGEMRM